MEQETRYRVVYLVDGRWTHEGFPQEWFDRETADAALERARPYLRDFTVGVQQMNLSVIHEILPEVPHGPAAAE